MLDCTGQLGRPFRAHSAFVSNSQGVALGWVGVPVSLDADEPRGIWGQVFSSLTMTQRNSAPVVAGLVMRCLSAESR